MDIKPKVFKVDYEATFLVTPDVTDAEYREIVAKFMNLIKANDGEVLNIEYWGSRKLAYPVAKKHNAFYAFVEFRALGTFVNKLETEFRYDERILRHLVTKLDKHAVAYNLKRREQGFGMRQNLEPSKS